MRIAIIGGGSWGTALGVHLAKKNHQIKIWEFFAEQAKEMQEQRTCRLLPEVKLPEQIYVCSDLELTLKDSEAVLVVVPSDKVEVTLKNAASFIQEQPVILCSKGFASGQRLLSDVVQSHVKGNVYCLYGPTHAEEVCKGMFTGIVLAGKKGKERTQLKKALEHDDFRVEASEDLIGVQVAAALKNILAIFIGVLDGLQLGDNSKAYVMTKGLGDIRTLGVALGAKKETFYSLAGMGDLIVTCSSKHSRNRHVGEQIGKGRMLDEVLAEMKMVSEGVTNAKEAVLLQKKLGLHLPLISGLHEILFEGKSAKEVLKKI
ncbi:NAD(P)-dependent glycerol-3-phosphate dehydrogenase [Candidatus Woesearchaeota archaeon]|nr:NAD(P)-dependent glycerol-3-phosphate dehydrogenase [Candidatus Woesearchaeota archaeon]